MQAGVELNGFELYGVHVVRGKKPYRIYTLRPYLLYQYFTCVALPQNHDRVKMLAIASERATDFWFSDLGKFYFHKPQDALLFKLRI